MPAPSLVFADILAGLSHALDITEGHPRGHAARSCVIGMRLADLVGIPESDRADLFYALLLKDAGCSSNAARVHQLFGGNDHEVKRAVWMRDWRRPHHQIAYALRYTGRGESPWSRVKRLIGLAASPDAGREIFQIRCDRGAAIARDLGLSDATAGAIRSMDEHWDGGGHPSGLRGDQIPLLARIVGLAQVLEIFADDASPETACAVARRRRGRWFDPQLVDALGPLERDATFWTDLRARDERELISTAEPMQALVDADDERLDRISAAFAAIIDAKSPYTSDHSRRVADYCVSIAEQLCLPADDVVRLRRAGLLHDIGKLAVPNSILDKPGALTPDEWRIVQTHPRHTFDVLNRVPIFRELAFDASCHHETLDGRGYHLGLMGNQLSPSARIIAVADRADALLADRPYRKGLPIDEVRVILQAECDRGATCAKPTDALLATLGSTASV